jgi:hypothetical protein
MNLPVVLGSTVFLRHVRHASLSGTPVVIQSLQTVRGGRLYKVELVCAVDSPNRRDYEASLKKYRDDGYAVAANMKFAAAAATEENPPAASGETNPSPEANPAPSRMRIPNDQAPMTTDKRTPLVIGIWALVIPIR